MCAKAVSPEPTLCSYSVLLLFSLCWTKLRRVMPQKVIFWRSEHKEGIGDPQSKAGHRVRPAYSGKCWDHCSTKKVWVWKYPANGDLPWGGTHHSVQHLILPWEHSPLKELGGEEATETVQHFSWEAKAKAVTGENGSMHISRIPHHTY